MPRLPARPNDRDPDNPGLRPGLRRAVVTTAAAATACALVAAPSSAPAAPTGPAAAPSADSTRIAVSGVRFAWGLTNESSNRGFAPGTVNLFSAGTRANPGSSKAMTKAEWRARAGAVTVQKRKPGGAYAKATWRGLSTQPNGQPLGAPTAGTFSRHRIVIGQGSGTVDPAANTAVVRWKGSFTVAYYSGMTYYVVSDPTLTVKPNGTGTVMATLSGYGTSMDDMSQWVPLPSKRVSIANLRGVKVRKAGFTTTPAYRKVRYAAPAGSPAQVRSGAHWGSFPKAFVAYQQRTGQASYWYSSGGATDAFKTTLPLTVTF